MSTIHNEPSNESFENQTETTLPAAPGPGAFSSNVTKIPAVSANGTNGAHGVDAISDTGTGVSAVSSTGVGLYATSNMGQAGVFKGDVQVVNGILNTGIIIASSSTELHAAVNANALNAVDAVDAISTGPGGIGVYARCLEDFGVYAQASTGVASLGHAVGTGTGIQGRSQVGYGGPG